MPLSLLILVAAIQGLTEFLPISSSGHLVLIPIVTDFVYQGRMIDVAAHVGTLIAVAFYLRAEIIAIAVAMLRLGRNDPEHARLGIMLVLATIPVIIAGYIVNYANWQCLTWFTALPLPIWYLQSFYGLPIRCLPRGATLVKLACRIR